ncbi:MAG: ribbon-helix-helix protein, CopG family [Dissulfuribacterales bacterium]
MATKTYRTIFLDQELDTLIQEQAALESSSISKLIRVAIERYLDLKRANMEEYRGTPMDNSQ